MAFEFSLLLNSVWAGGGAWATIKAIMKTAILFTFVAGLLLAAGGPVPRKAGELSIQTEPGKFIQLSHYAGKTIVVAFILTDCPHCQATTKILNDIQRDYASRGVQVVETALDAIMAPAHVAEFRSTYATAFPVGYNTTNDAAKFLAYAPGVPMLMPGIVVIDRNGTIQAQFDGDDDAMRTPDKTLRYTLDQALKVAKAAPPPPAPTDKKKP